MNMQQVKWAMQHDWFKMYSFSDTEDLTKGYVIWVADVEVDTKTKEVSKKLKTFEDFKELKVWAGY